MKTVAKYACLLTGIVMAAIMVEEPAPGGYNLLGDVITQSELEDVAAQYQVITGFDRDSSTAPTAQLRLGATFRILESPTRRR